MEKVVVTNQYLLGLGGEQVTVLGQNAAWQWTNVYAGGKQLATYNGANAYFALTDWLGTKRVELSVTEPSTVTVAEQCLSLPYGDGLDCTGTDVNQLHYTGKERDTESNNDYFGARYYAGNIAGRWLTPDWSSKVEPVPYAKLDDPQSLNLYAYVGNNPLSTADADGHTNLLMKLIQNKAGVFDIFNIFNVRSKDKSQKDESATANAQNDQKKQQQNGSTKERIIEGVSGTANLGVAVGRGVSVVGEGMATPVTAGASAALAAYESVQTVSQAGAGLTQIGGAISGKTTETNEAADLMIVSTSIAGDATLAATNGNLDAAAKAAAVEGLVSAAWTRSIFNGVGSMIDTVMNLTTAVQAAPVPPPPPGPGCSVAGAC